MNKPNDFPPGVEVLFTQLSKEVIWLHARWILFQQLYGESQERIDLLNTVASSYFYTTQSVLLDDIILAICRLTDPPKVNKSENLTLKQIILELDRPEYVELKDSLDVKLKEIDNLSKAIREYRNKKLAHFDKDIALKTAELFPKFSLGEIDKCLKLIRDFLNECELFFLDSETVYESFLMNADGNRLITYLKKAMAYDQLEKEGLVQRGYWRKLS